jgi:hypothetical protein
LEGGGKNNKHTEEDDGVCKERLEERRLLQRRCWQMGLLFFAVLLILLYSSRGHKLRLNLPKGFCATVRVKHSRDSGAGLGGRKLGMNLGAVRAGIELANEYRIECLDVDADGVMTVRQTCKDLQLDGLEITMRMPGGESEKAELDKPLRGELEEALKDLGRVDLSLVIRVRPNGQTVNVQGADSFADQLLSLIAAPDDPNYLQMRSHLIDWIESDRLIGSMDKYPLQRRRPGQTWKRKIDRSGPFLLGFRNTHEEGTIKFSRVLDGSARLEQDLNFELETEGNRWIQNRGRRKGGIVIKQKGRMTGRVEVDVKTGFLKSGRIVAQGELTQYPRKYDLMKDSGLYWITVTDMIEIETIFDELPD